MFWSYWVNQLSTGMSPMPTADTAVRTVTATVWMIWSSHWSKTASSRCRRARSVRVKLPS